MRQNAAERMPRRIVCMDTESWQDKTLRHTEHTFRLGCATFDTISAGGRQYGDTLRYDTDDPEALWGWITLRVNAQHRTIVFAHNLSFDVRVSSAFVYLPRLGFECKGMALNSYGFWARWQRDRQTLWLADSLSFLPAPLEKIAEAARMDKPPLPTDDDDTATWLHRCRCDVDVTREAMLRVIRYLHDERLGDFRLTGAAQGSAAFRHRFMHAKTLLVHDDDEALARERRSAWAGRAEVWKHGHTSEQLSEYDYEYAYARLAQQHEVPSRLIASHSPIPRGRFETVLNHYAVLADVVVNTETPCVPCQGDTHIIWPVGTFRTTLWDCELRMIEANGGTFEVERYWYYQRRPLLRPWAEWIMGELDKTSAELDPIVRFMLKDWSRSLIGRFGLRYPVLDEIARMRSYDVISYPVSSMDGEPDTEYLQIGQQLFEKMDVVESPSSTPMVMSYIMATGRVRLWELMQRAGLDNIYHADTDGVIVGVRGARALDSCIKSGAVPGLRRKAVFSGGTFRAPRNIDLGNTRRVVGAPKRAERLAPSLYRGEVWESLPAALQRRHIGSVYVHEQTFSVSDEDHRRLHLDDGATAPHRLQLDQQEIEVSA